MLLKSQPSPPTCFGNKLGRGAVMIIVSVLPQNTDILHRLFVRVQGVSKFLFGHLNVYIGIHYCVSVCTGCPIKKATQAFGSCSRTRVPILFKLTTDIVWKMAKIIATKANSLGVLPHLECVWLRRLHFCCFHWTRRSLPKKFSWDHPKTRLDFEKCPEQKDKSLRTPFASNYDRNRLWDVRQGCQPPPFGGPWACPRWPAGSGPTSSAFSRACCRWPIKCLC